MKNWTDFSSHWPTGNGITTNLTKTNAQERSFNILQALNRTFRRSGIILSTT